MGIEYQTENADTNWKIYDVNVRGVGLVTAYRHSFTDIVRSRGVNGSIDSLGGKNRDFVAKAASRS